MDRTHPNKKPLEFTAACFEGAEKGCLELEEIDMSPTPKQMSPAKGLPQLSPHRRARERAKPASFEKGFLWSTDGPGMQVIHHPPE